MDYISTYFLNETCWKNYGSNWLRQAKLNNLNALVYFCKDLNSSVFDKASEFGFKIRIIENKFGYMKSNYYNQLISDIKKEDRVYVVSPSSIPKKLDFFEVDVAAEFCNVSISELTNFIINLKEKAFVIRELNKIVDAHGRLFDSKCFYSNYNFISSYLGFLNMNYDRYNCEFPEQAVFNMHIHSGKFTVNALKNDTL
jgi:hypothetical protein